MTAATNDIEAELAHLRDLDLEGLRARWRSVFRRRAPDHLPRHLLGRIIAYRLQADRFGDLDAKTRRHLERLGDDASGATARSIPAVETPAPGTVLVREWNGALQRVMVLDDGFAWNGTTYRSLSQVAFAITGTRWSGPRFFGLRGRSERPS
ncbi:DUF2924 domain-containing protein [Blastochloris sulfoviridis]|uniref:DUF2924 domain-containing protein n=1 Tax=Blastochloris sulfoviridis TaxID=50712 RepID=A0A5M6HHP5_9HYPH|nr:DUF2924 domain-containing protein [Blastochloris sulfoviridis]KAA5595394.1 DUF2924 domain-containing protein [Blastochloris sulfoviridis]